VYTGVQPQSRAYRIVSNKGNETAENTRVDTDSCNNRVVRAHHREPSEVHKLSSRYPPVTTNSSISPLETWYLDASNSPTWTVSSPYSLSQPKVGVALGLPMVTLPGGTMIKGLSGVEAVSRSGCAGGHCAAVGTHRFVGHVAHM
jgi:hypothetical protein